MRRCGRRSSSGSGWLVAARCEARARVGVSVRRKDSQFSLLLRGGGGAGAAAAAAAQWDRMPIFGSFQKGALGIFKQNLLHIFQKGALGSVIPDIFRKLMA